jgi:hypothetical protein
MADIAKLKIEITTDPLGRGYAGMTDAQVVTDINTVYRTTNKATMTGSEVLNTIVKTEFNALTAANKQLVWDLIHLGALNPFGIEADLLIDIFGAGSATIIALAAARKNNVSRAEELGLGNIREGHIQEAKL